MVVGGYGSSLYFKNAFSSTLYLMKIDDSRIKFIPTFASGRILDDEVRFHQLWRQYRAFERTKEFKFGSTGLTFDIHARHAGKSWHKVNDRKVDIKWTVSADRKVINNFERRWSFLSRNDRSLIFKSERSSILKSGRSLTK